MTNEKKLIAAVIVLVSLQAVGFLIAAAWKFTGSDFLAGVAALVVFFGFSFITYTAIKIFRAENRRKA